MTPSRLHWNETPASLAEKAKVALVSVVATCGPLVIVVTGGVMSPLVQEYSAGVRSTAPLGPFARTSSSCSPNGRLVNVTGELHAVNGARSSEHSKVAPALGSAAKLKVASLLPVSKVGPNG